MAMKKGPTKGSGGKHRNSLRGKGPTPKAEDRVYHKAYKEKQATNRRKMADPRLAARRRAAKFPRFCGSVLGFSRRCAVACPQARCMWPHASNMMIARAKSFVSPAFMD